MALNWNIIEVDVTWTLFWLQSNQASVYIDSITYVKITYRLHQEVYILGFGKRATSILNKPLKWKRCRMGTISIWSITDGHKEGRLIKLASSFIISPYSTPICMSEEGNHDPEETQKA